MNCPYCNAPVKHHSQPRNQYPTDRGTLPTTFECGTVTSEHWSPPVRGNDCEETKGRDIENMMLEKYPNVL